MSVAFNPDGTILASSSEDGTVRFWKVNPWMKILMGHETEVFSVSINSQGNNIASSDSDGNVKLWNVHGEIIENYLTSHGFISSIEFSPSNQLLVTGNIDGTVTLLDFTTTPLGIPNYESSSFSIHQSSIWDIDFSPDGKALASVADDKTIRLWNREEDKITTLLSYSAIFRSISWSNDGGILGAVSEDGIVHLFNSNYELLEKFPAHSDKIYRINFSPDRFNLFATSSQDKTVKLWQFDGNLVNVLEGHEAGVWDVKFSPNRNLIATGSDDKTIKLWTVDGELLATLKGHKEAVNSISFSPDGNLLISGSSDRTIRLWDVSEVNLQSWTLRGCDWVLDYLNSNIHDGKTKALQDVCLD